MYADWHMSTKFGHMLLKAMKSANDQAIFSILANLINRITRLCTKLSLGLELLV